MDNQTDESAPGNFRKGVKAAQSFIKKVSDTAQWVDQQLSSPDHNFSMDDCIGLQAEVTVSVPVGGMGEVIFSAGGSTQHQPAKARDKRKSFKRGERVQVVEAAHNVLYIDDVTARKSKVPAPSTAQNKAGRKR